MLKETRFERLYNDIEEVYNVRDRTLSGQS